MTTRTWRVVDELGGVREVPVRVEGGQLHVGAGPGPRVWPESTMPRLAVASLAVSMGWPVREILAPEDAERAGLLGGLLDVLLAVIHRDGGHYTLQHGVGRSCTDALRRVLYDREALAMVERERDGARSDCRVMSRLHGDRSEDLIAAKRDLAAESARCAGVCRAVGEGRAGPPRTATAERALAAHDCAEAIERGAVSR